MSLRNELFAMQFAPIRITPDRDVVRIQHATLGARAKAPWPDFAGNPIYEGDEIEHPSGERGVVVFLAPLLDPGDQWRVDYGTGRLSRLGLQIGEKGMAVVVPNIQC